MAIQNLVSASLSAEKKADIQQKLTDIRNHLDFLVSLQPEDIHGLVKAGNTLLPFVDKAHQAVTLHPDILPRVFSTEEFKRDYSLVKDLQPLLAQVNQLAEGMQNTLLAANSDALSASLEVYAAVRQHKDKVIGLNILAEEMGVFFKRSKRMTAKV